LLPYYDVIIGVMSREVATVLSLEGGLSFLPRVTEEVRGDAKRKTNNA
jgi:hypothetical protein